MSSSVVQAHGHSAATSSSTLIMKFIASTAVLAATALAAPTEITCGPPPGGWNSIDYPAGAGENLHYYPPPPGGWESVHYPGTGAGGDDKKCDSPFTFTSIFHVVAVGSEVRNGITPAPGPKEAVGFFTFGINSEHDTICYVSPFSVPRVPSTSTNNPRTSPS